MRVLFALAALLVIAGCDQQSTDDEAASEHWSGSSSPSTPSEPRAEAAAKLLAKPFVRDEETELLDFHYAWPAEAASIPALDRRFRSELAKAEAEARKMAANDHAGVVEDKREWHPRDFTRDWKTVGESQRLLSLEASSYQFTGGAHGTSSSGGLLWDRQLDRETGIEQLMQAGKSWSGAIRRPFCVLLDRERTERRAEPVKKDDMFGDCPALKDLTLLLADADGDSRFDHVKIVADQYVAGPYSEGPYEISLPITVAMAERLKPDYRPSFEAQPPVQ